MHCRAFPLRQGATGVARYAPSALYESSFDARATLPSQVAAQVKDYAWSKSRTFAPFMDLAMTAAEEALADAGLLGAEEEDGKRALVGSIAQATERIGVAIGSSVSSPDDIVDVGVKLEQGKYRRISPYFVPRVLANLAGGHVAMRYGLRGPNHAVSTACATGAHAIGDASRFILFGDADIMLAGGADSCVSYTTMAGFSRLQALSKGFNETPERASRPFDRDRDGFVIGEGAGVLVLEELEHAKARGATIYAEVLGYGLSCDAHHITAPRDDGDGAQRAMRMALGHARAACADVGYINAHATSTPVGDEIETRAIRAVFGSHADKLAVSSSKGALGHLLGAAGAVESLLTVLALRHAVVPPTLNLDNPGPGCDLDYVADAADLAGGRKAPGLRVAINNSFGFGGTNASVVFGAHEA